MDLAVCQFWEKQEPRRLTGWKSSFFQDRSEPFSPLCRAPCVEVAFRACYKDSKPSGKVNKMHSPEIRRLLTYIFRGPLGVALFLGYLSFKVRVRNDI